MNILGMTFVAATLTVQGVFWKIFLKNGERNITDTLIYNAVSSAIIAVITFLISGIKTPSRETVIIAVIFGIDNIIMQLVYARAIATGPLSYTVLFSSCSMLMATFSGALFWNEGISIIQIIGICLLVFAFFMAVRSRTEGSVKITKKWLFFAFATFFFNGLIGVLQKLHQIIMPGLEINECIIIAFLTSSLLSGLLAVFNTKLNAKSTIKPRSNVPVLIVIYSVLCVATNKVMFYLINVIDSAVLFPTVNGMLVIMSSVIALMFFKERLSKVQAAGLLIGLISLILIGRA